MKKFFLFILISLISLQLSLLSLSATEDIDYEELFANHQSVMLIIDPITGDIFYANQAAADFYGYSLDTLLSMNIDEINTLTPEEVAEERLKALEEERNFFIFKHRLSNDEIRTVYVYSYPIDIGGTQYLYSIIIDQTDYINTQNFNRLLIVIGISVLGIAIVVTTYLLIKISYKKREIEKVNEILFESEQRFKILHDASFGGLAIHDQGFILDCNQGLSDITGFSIKELVGKDGLLLIAPDYRDEVRNKIKSGYEKPYEVFGIKKDESIYPLRLEARNIPYHGKKVRVVEFRDITELREQSEQKEIIQTHWSKLIQEMPLGFNIREMIYDSEGYPIDYVFQEMNDSYEHITGLKREEIIGRKATDVLPLIEPSWIQSYASVVKHKKTIVIEDFSRQLQKYFRVVAYPYQDNQFITVVEDITERKKFEKQLIESEEQKSRIISNLPGVSYQCKFDEDWTMLYMSDACETLTGYKPNELIDNHKLSFNDLIDPKYREYLYKQWNNAKEKNEPCNIEYEIIKKDGTKIWVWEKGKTYQQDGEWLIEGFLMDITTRKLSEEKIEHISKHDFLTGLPNRRYYDQVIKELDRPENYPLIVSVLDIDGLKLINDTYGHHVGDETLIKFANELSKVCKYKTFVSRVGGDEFVTVTTQISVDEFEDFKNKVLEDLSKIKIRDVPLSVSCGTAVKHDIFQKIDDILIEAENEMYAKKTLHNQSSRNQVIVALFESLKDKYEAERHHSDRVSSYCLKMGYKLNLSKQDILELEFAGRMHDIGKITIPDNILKKPGKLTDEEWVIMKSHTINGYQILKSADKYSSLADYALTHHERWDGKGYPKGLKGEDIPLFSRIINISDAFEAMTSDRPYRKAMSVMDAVKELRRCTGTQFDPDLVEIFIYEILAEEYPEIDFRKIN